MARLGTGLLILGLLAVTYGALWQFGLAPGSRVSLPPPVVVERTAAATRVVPATVEVAAPRTPIPAAPLEPLVVRPRTDPPAPVPTAAPIRLVAADAFDRTQPTPRETGHAVRLAIAAINLDTRVAQGGIVKDPRGNPAWQTLPFVAVHYGDLTSLIGAPGNAVIAGHVVTLSEGNVFRSLYKLEIDDRIDVWDEHDHAHAFHVVEVKLVPPDDVSVMAPTADETLTLITCGGTFDPVKREFSDRLIVTAKPLQADRLEK